MAHNEAESVFSLARERLLGASGLEEADLVRALARLSRGADWADIYLQETVSRDWLLEEGTLKTGSFTIDRGAGLRAVTGEQASLAYANELSAQALLRCAAAASQMNSARRTHGPDALELRTSAPRYRSVTAVGQADCERQTALLDFVDREARKADPRVKEVTASVQSESDTVLLSAMDGRLMGDVRPMVYLSITVIVEDKGRRERASSGGGGRVSMDFFTEARVSGWIRGAVSEALHNLDASPAPCGRFPVVLGPGWPGILLHEAVGHGLEGDFIRKGTSAFAGQFGKRVAAPGVTVIDDGTIADRRGSLTFDDEGTPTSRTVLIEDGILTGAMLDLTNARLMGKAPTGNGRRESFASLPMPRMTNTFMAAGDKSPEEIIASVDYGIYAQNFSGGQVDITNGQFVFSMSKAWLIEKGRLTRPIKGAMLSGNGKTALRHIRMIGCDAALDEGTGQCGKDGDQVPVSVGMPTIRIDALTIGGSELAAL